MFQPKYPHSDTHTYASSGNTPTALPVPTDHANPPASSLATSRPGLVEKARTKPVAIVTGVVVVGAVLTSMLLAVAITGLALSISGVVLLILVRMLRQEFHR
ncbi:SpdD protein [Streptomyces sp. NPDC005166]